MLATIVKYARGCCAAAVLFAIPAYAFYSVAPQIAARPASVALADEDDPIRNGMNIVERPTAASPRAEAARSGTDSDLILLTDWVFTSKGKPSPYN
jgi:hypothetical protein